MRLSRRAWRDAAIDRRDAAVRYFSTRSISDFKAAMEAMSSS